MMGSLFRNTAINPINDIDILVCFKWITNFTLKEATDLVKSTNLSQTWTQQGHSIRGNLDGINFDIVPAFDDGKLYKYVNDQAGNFVETNPEKGAQIIAEKDKAFGGHLVPCIRMLKCWNTKNSVAEIKPLKSYHLEVLCANIEPPENCAHISTVFGYILSKLGISPPEFPPENERNIANYLDEDKNIPFTREKLVLHFDNLAKENKLDPLLSENWYSVTSRQVRDRKGGSSVLEYYNGSFTKALEQIYPNIGLDRNKFSVLPSGYWKEEANRKVAETTQYQQMRRMMQSQAQTIKDLRRRLQKYGPDACKEEDA